MEPFLPSDSHGQKPLLSANASKTQFLHESRFGALGLSQIWLGEGHQGRRQRPGVDQSSDKRCPILQEKQVVKTKCKRTHALDTISVKFKTYTNVITVDIHSYVAKV